METLARKVAIVTGGGRGLGEAVCHALAERKAIAITADIRYELAENVATAIQAKGLDAIAFDLDVSNQQQVETLVKKVVASYGKVDILINNAGTDLTAAIEDLPVQEWKRILDVNLNGPFMISKAVFPVMRQQGHGSIINIVSTAAKRAWANAAAYHASKWGLLGFSHALHVEGRPHRIKVSALVAGGMRTPFLLERFPDLDVSTLQDPKNVAQAVIYLLQQPLETVIPEMMVLPMTETSWP